MSTLISQLTSRKLPLSAIDKFITSSSPHLLAKEGYFKYQGVMMFRGMSRASIIVLFSFVMEIPNSMHNAGG